MIALLIEAAMKARWVVLVLAAATAAFGVYAFRQQPVDAYPDISSQMVQIITVYPGRAPEEVERQVTVPIEIGMRTVPKVEVIRSRTIFGLSVVQLIFEEGTRQGVAIAVSAPEVGATLGLDQGRVEAVRSLHARRVRPKRSGSAKSYDLTTHESEPRVAMR